MICGSNPLTATAFDTLRIGCLWTIHAVHFDQSVYSKNSFLLSWFHPLIVKKNHIGIASNLQIKQYQVVPYFTLPWSQ